MHFARFDIPVVATAASLALAACTPTPDIAQPEGNDSGGPASSTQSDSGASMTTDTGPSSNTYADSGSVTAHTDSGSSAASTPGLGRVVLFGGQDANGFLGDTWTWDGTSWTQENVTGPSARAYAAGASLNGTVMMFGGENSTIGDLGETWTWSGSAWTQQNATGPSASHEAVASALDGNVVLFGVSGPDGFPQTWTWSGSAWANQSQDGNGPVVSGSWAATTFNNAVLLAGSGGNWDWDGTNWKATTTAGGPSANGGASAATLGNRVVLFGGEGQNFSSLNQTWTWDGTSWTIHSVTEPSPRSYAGMATLNGTLVLFGGCTFGFAADTDAGPTCTNDTWTWDGTSWTRHNVPGPSARAPALMVAEF